MHRFDLAVIGSVLITAVYVPVSVIILGLLAMSHCVLSQTEIAAGEACVQPADKFFWPLAGLLVVAFIVCQFVWLRRALRKA